jgi:long-chain fatty acid transport protein
MNSITGLGKILVGLSLAAISSSLFAGGLYITEFGDPSMGASGAGSGVLAEDASTAFHNPAGIMLLEPKKNHWMVSATYVAPSAKFSKDPGTTVTPLGPGAGNGGDAGETAIAPGFWWARPINDKFGAGFSLNSISAAVLDYSDDFVGRYWAKEVELLTINLMPSFAYRINDKWSVAFAVPVMFGSLDMDVRIPAVLLPQNPATDGQALIKDGDDVSATVSVSALWEATDTIRFGLAYMGENELKFNGDLKLTLGPMSGVTPPDVNVDVTIPFVQTIRLWNSTDFGPKATLLASVAWEDWSSFDNVLISTGGPSGALKRDWKDTWKFALGLRWRSGGPWTHYTGIAYDTSPTSAGNRTTDMPIDKQLRLSAGTTYTLQSGVSIGGALTYADYGDNEINNGSPNWGTVVGEYSTNRIIFFGVNVGW